MEMTGISREISGNTEPVTSSFSGSLILFAATVGYCSGWSTVTTSALPVSTACAGEAAPLAGSKLFLQPASASHPAKKHALRKREIFVMGLPRVLRQDSVALRMLDKRRSVVCTPAAPGGSRSAR